MKNILHVISVYFSVPYFFGNQFKYFNEKGYKIHLICSPAKELEDYAEKHKISVYQTTLTRAITPLKDIVSCVRICKYIRRNKIDIVVGHTPKGVMLSMVAAYVMRVPKRIYFCHGSLHERGSWIKRNLILMEERFVSMLATKVVCVSPYLIEMRAKLNLSPNKHRILNIGSCCGIDTKGIFNPKNLDENILNNIRSKHKIPNNGWIIGYVGRLANDKGIAELYESFIRFNNKYPDAYLLLVGPIDERDGISDVMHSKMQMDPNVIFTGYISENIQYFYQLMDVFVLPTHREGLGCSLLEASAMQKVILSNGDTGSRDTMIEGETGFYINISPESIFERLEYLYIHKSEAVQMGLAGRDFVHNNFKEEIIWPEIEKIFNED